MFGIWRSNKENKKAADRIGQILHQQIITALKLNEQEAGIKLNSSFTTGYIYGFIRFGFNFQKLEGEQYVDKYFKYICNGVIPNKLYEITQRRFAALELAKEIGKEEETKDFETGVEVGVYDASVFNINTNSNTVNLSNYLLGKKLNYKKIL